MQTSLAMVYYFIFVNKNLATEEPKIVYDLSTSVVQIVLSGMFSLPFCCVKMRVSIEAH